jgi:hypothetical protein
MSGNGVFNNVSANGMNVTGILQASQVITTQPMQVNDLKTEVKGETIVTTNSMFADVLATTQSGRIALAKALNYGTLSNVFVANKFTPLLSNGYSGKGVLYGHFESPLHFHVPPLRHVVNPIRITPINGISNVYNAAQLVASGIGAKAFPHRYATLSLAVGFDLHAKTTESRYQQVALDGCVVNNSDNTFMGAAYNADVAYTDILFNSAKMSEVFPDLPDLTDDMFVEGVQMAFNAGVKVASCSAYFGGYSGDYYNIEHSGTDYTGISNPIDYILSLAADNDMIFCQAVGNGGVPNGVNYANVAAATGGAGSGVMLLTTTNSRNTLSVGSKFIEDANIVASYNSGEPGDYVSYDNYIRTKDFVEVNYYKKPGEEKYSTTPAAGYTERVVRPLECHGTTADTAGPGMTHRVKPDIIGASGGVSIVWPTQDPRTVDSTSWLYATNTWGGTSATSPMVAGGVALLREALPLYDAHQIRECVLVTGSNGDLSNIYSNVGLGHGLINLEAALAYGQARPRKSPPTFAKSGWSYSAGFLSNIAGGALNTLNVYQPFNGSNTFTPKSVQSFKCPKDTTTYASNVAYQTAYDAYETSYNAYVASASNLWSGSVLDLSPVPGLWLPNIIGVKDINIDGSGPTFDVKSNKSWISVADEDMQEIKDLMVANGIKVRTTSKLLGAFSVVAESPEQLAAVVNGQSKIRDVKPVMKLRVAFGIEETPRQD